MQILDKMEYKVHNAYMWIHQLSQEVHLKLMHQRDKEQYKPHNQNNEFHQQQIVCLVHVSHSVERPLHFQ